MTEHISKTSYDLGRYQIVEKIGVGGMATVYKAIDQTLERTVAIKILHEHLVEQATFRERFEREAKVIASFRHPNIMSIYDYAHVQEDIHHVYYMVMPYITGHTLADEIARYRQQHQTMPHKRINQIIQDLCNALEYAHERQMVHRDVKPGNILFEEDGHLLLTDFGIARLAVQGAFTQDGAILGTPAYMAPEQASGDEVDFRTDMYAVGVILFEMLTGRLPFGGDGTLNVLMQHVNSPVPRISDLLPDENPILDAVIDTVLHKNPQKRYPSLSALAEAVRLTLQPTKMDTNDAIRASSPRPMSHYDEVAPTIHFNQTPSSSLRMTQSTMNTLFIQPVKQNPLAFLALAIAIISLLIVARVIQQAPAVSTQVTEQTSPNSRTSPPDASADTMVGEPYFRIEFASDDPALTSFPTGTSDMPTRVITEDGYILREERGGVATPTMLEPPANYGDIVLEMRGTLLEDSAVTSGYGLIFRYQDRDNYHVFAVDGRGHHSIWVRESGNWRELRNAGENWTRHESIRPAGGENILRLVVHENTFTGYINAEEIFTVEDATLSDGNIGFYMATPSNGIAHVQISEFSISPYDASSMTDETESDSMTDG